MDRVSAGVKRAVSQRCRGDVRPASVHRCDTDEVAVGIGDNEGATTHLVPDFADLATRIRGNRLLNIEASNSPDLVRIEVGYSEIDGVRQLIQ